MLFQEKKVTYPEPFGGDMFLTLFLKRAVVALGKSVFHADVPSSLEELREEFMELKVWLFWLETSR